MKNGLKLALVTLPLALIGAGVLALVISGKTSPLQEEAGKRATSVRVITARPLVLTPKIVGYGRVEPATVWTAIAQVGGEVVAMADNFEKGALLAGGTEVVRLSPADYNLAIAQAEANIRAAEARLAELETGERNTRASLDMEQEALALAEAELARSKELNASGVVAQSSLDKVAASVVAQRQKRAAIAGALALIPSQRAVLAEQIAVYQVSLESARLNLERTRIVLPFDARVAAAETEMGQFVKQGQTIGVFDEVGAAEIETQLAITRFRTLLDAVAVGSGGGFGLTDFDNLAERAGFSARVKLRMGDDYAEWPGTVVRVSDSIDVATGTLGVIVSVADAYGGARTAEKPPLTKGMFVEVELRTSPVADVIMVPRAAVHGGQVYVVDGGNQLRIRQIETGLQQGDFIVIAQGLAAGERVVVGQLSYAVDGMALKPLDDPELASRLAAEAGEGAGSE